jgi:hypothetical protein
VLWSIKFEGESSFGHTIKSAYLESLFQLNFEFLKDNAGLLSAWHVCPTPFKENFSFLHQVWYSRPSDLHNMSVG